MSQFIKTVGLLLCRWQVIAVYLILNVILSTLIVNGFQITDEYSATFWGLQLSGFHITGKGIVESAYIEFCQHT